MIKKLFSLAAAVLVCAGVWAESVTFSAEDMSEKGTGVTKGKVTAFCPTKVGDQQWYKDGSNTIKGKAISIGSSADTAVIVPASGKSIHFRMADGYTITGISIEAAANKDSICGEPIVIWSGAINKTPAYVGTIEAPSRAESSKPAPIVVTNIPEGATAFAVYRRIKYNSSTGEIGTGSNFGRSQQTWNIFNVTVEYTTSCATPTEALVLTSDANETVYVGDVINLSTTGGNGAGISVEGTAEETLGGYAGLTWTATAGEHTFVATQVKYNGFCAQESELVFNVLEKNPVTAVTIDGPTAAYVGYKLTYTATAANATAYEWYLDDVKQGSDSAKFIYTAVKGNHSIVCKARNDFNAEDAWITSDPIALTVTKVCGDLIHATLTDGTHATVTGVVGGTADAALSSSRKMDKGKYFGLTLGNGTFMAGDVVTIVMSTAGENYPCLFGDKDRKNLLFLATETSSELTYEIVLSAAANGLKSIYISRDGDDATYKWNPTVSEMYVTRSCEDSNDASVTSLTVNGETVAKDAEANKFEYTVSAAYVEEDVTVAFTIHPLATSDKENNTFTIPTPEAGDTNGASFKVTAEDGTQVTYTVFISKSASLSTDATLKALSVEDFTLAPAFDPAVVEYTITKAYEAALPATSKVTATANDANATVNVAYNELVENEILVQVIAEDEETAKTYSIRVLSAPAVKKINEVILTNGYSAYILEGQAAEPFVINGFYLAGEDAPTVKNYKVNEGTTWAQEGNAITLTGADASTATYSLVLAAVEPVDYTADKITFDGTETWIKSGYGFDATKKWRFSKTDNDYSREITGKTHIEMFLPACDTIVLTESNTASRDIKIYANGVQIGDKVNLEKNKDLKIVVEQSKAFMLTIASAQTGGDGGVGAIRLAKKAVIPTAINNTDAAVQTVKVIRNGQLIIIRDGKEFNVLGTAVK